VYNVKLHENPSTGRLIDNNCIYVGRHTGGCRDSHYSRFLLLCELA